MEESNKVIYSNTIVVEEVFVEGLDIRDGEIALQAAPRGDDYYVRYDAINSTRSDDRLTAEVAFVGSMR